MVQNFYILSAISSGYSLAMTLLFADRQQLLPYLFIYVCAHVLLELKGGTHGVEIRLGRNEKKCTICQILHEIVNFLRTY